MADLDGDDEFPNDFDGFDFDNIPALQAPTTNTGRPLSVRDVAPVAPPPASPAPSTGSNSVDEIDSSFLAAVDEIEARAIGEISSGSDSSVRADPETTCNHVTDSTSDDMRVPVLAETGGIEQSRKRSVQSLEICITNKKGKMKAEQDQVDVRAILEGYEVELTCPICCDIMYTHPVHKSVGNEGLNYDLFSVGAQVANPCGHTCCGECSYSWLDRNKYAPSCALCRSSLHAKKPLLPNFALDNIVRQHIQFLAETGRPEWQVKGYRCVEWTKRSALWKKQTDARAAEEKVKEAARIRRRQARYPDDYAYIHPWRANEAEDEEDEEDVFEVSRVATRFARRR